MKFILLELNKNSLNFEELANRMDINKNLLKYYLTIFEEQGFIEQNENQFHICLNIQSILDEFQV